MSKKDRVIAEQGQKIDELNRWIAHLLDELDRAKVNASARGMETR